MGLWAGLETDGPEVDSCAEWSPGCVALAQFTNLQLLTGEEVLDPWNWDGDLPEGWVAVRSTLDGVYVDSQPIADVSRVADGLEPGNLVLLRATWALGDASVARLDPDG